jgi:hypothetical protein
MEIIMKKFLLLSLLSLSALSIQSAEGSSDPVQLLPDSEQPVLKGIEPVCTCGKVFMTLPALQIHIKQERKINPKSKEHGIKNKFANSQKCKFCKKTFTRVNNGIGNHEEQCRILAQQAALVDQRKMKKVKTEQSGVLTCDFPGCNETFHNKVALYNHKTRQCHSGLHARRCLALEAPTDEAPTDDDNQ